MRSHLEPRRNRIDVPQVPGRQRHREFKGLFLREAGLVAIEREEDDRRMPADALVATDERMAIASTSRRAADATPTHPL